MPRKGHIAKRTVEPDPVYGSDLVTKFVNSMMWQGKKSTAEGIFYEALTRLQTKGGDEALKMYTAWPRRIRLLRITGGRRAAAELNEQSRKHRRRAGSPQGRKKESCVQNSSIRTVQEHRH